MSPVWNVTPTPASIVAAGTIPNCLEVFSSWVPEASLPLCSTGVKVSGCRNQYSSLGQRGPGLWILSISSGAEMDRGALGRQSCESVTTLVVRVSQEGFEFGSCFGLEPFHILSY